MTDYVSPDARRKMANGLMAAQYDRATPEEGNVAQRHGLLPLATYDNGRTGLAFPGFVAEPVESFNRLLQNGYQGGTGDTRGVEDAFNVAGAAMMGGLAAPKPRNVVGSAGGELRGAALGAVPDTPGIRAYHGSPHDFDKFDLSKIGTGEGAQAYGHGLYFAENEGVAQTYKGAGPKQQWSSLDPPNVDGKMYEVNIKANPDDFLDWDKPLSQQSEKVASALSKVPETERLARQPIDPELGPPLPFDLLGEILTNREWSRNGMSMYEPEISKALKDAGIPGVRYLDQGSRSAGQGSSNYVVFDDNLIEILRKYGLLGMAGGAAAAEYGSQNSLLPTRPASPRYRPGDA